MSVFRLFCGWRQKSTKQIICFIWRVSISLPQFEVPLARSSAKYQTPISKAMVSLLWCHCKLIRYFSNDGMLILCSAAMVQLGLQIRRPSWVVVLIEPQKRVNARASFSCGKGSEIFLVMIRCHWLHNVLAEVIGQFVLVSQQLLDVHVIFQHALCLLMTFSPKGILLLECL